MRLSIDDFGTGYSSLSYLKRFPVDHVKIDRSFVEGLDAPDTSEESLCSAIIAMATALGMTTVAEGVETVNQAGRLRVLGADRAQGYLFSRPLAPEFVPEALNRLGVTGALVAVPDPPGHRPGGCDSGRRGDDGHVTPVPRADQF